MKRTKIICTLGPAVDDEQTLRELLEAGMDVARFNFSHGTYEEHAARMDRIRKVRDAMGSPCALLLDTKGPEIRTGLLAGGQPVMLKENSEIVLTTEVVEGTAECVTQTAAVLPGCVSEGDSILLDDGLIGLVVERVAGNDVVCRVKNAGMLGQRKSVNVPGVSVPLPAVTDQDRADLLFGIRQGVDFVAASFVRDARAVLEIKDYLRENGGGDIGVIAKIENADAVDNIEEIIAASDGIMVARGDLGVEVPPYRVPHIQKRIIRACNEARKPVITATQMLDSMIRNPRATRAEVADVANAIYDGSDCVMLSGETTIGKYPIEAVKTMASIAEACEAHLFEDSDPGNRKTVDTTLVSLAVGNAAVRTAESIGARCIICPTMTGRSARLISSFRTPVPIYSVTPSDRVMRSMQLFWGVVPMLGDVQGDMQRVIDVARDTVLGRGLLREGDIAVITAGDRNTSPLMAKPNEQERFVPANVMYLVQIRPE